MCSIGDDNIDDLENNKYMPEKSKISLHDKCNKCREKTPCVVLRAKDKYCKSCFIAGTVHKFKALLGKHKIIRPNDRVLIFHKGGHPSTSLLHFIRTGLDLETHKKLRFYPVVIFIDCFFHLSLTERKEVADRIEKETLRFNFETYFIAGRDFIANEVNKTTIMDKAAELDLKENDKVLYNEDLSKLDNKSLRIDYYNMKKRQFLIRVAKYLNCKFIFTPELSSDIASQLLTDISLGRGSHAPLDTGFCDSRDAEVKILRPLRLFDSKESVFYNYFNNLEPVIFREEVINSYESIQSLMKKFVSDLQVNYPATVTTVLKTGDKLGIVQEITRKCDICLGPLEEQNTTLTSSESTEFSHYVSNQVLDYSLSPQERYNRLLDGYTSNVSDKCCYACKKLKM